MTRENSHQELPQDPNAAQRGQLFPDAQTTPKDLAGCAQTRVSFGFQALALGQLLGPGLKQS